MRAGTVGGMLAATIFGLALVPVLYAIIERMREGGAAESGKAENRRRVDAAAVGD